jgi:hypothetical protein
MRDKIKAAWSALVVRHCKMRSLHQQGIFTRCFVYIFWDWWSGMRGPLSIIFAVLAVGNFLSARKEFVFLAFVALLVTVGRLAYRSVSRFRITTCSEAERNSAYNYVSFGRNPPFRVLFYQVRVDLLGKGSVTNCCARLISIHKDRTVKWQGQAVELTFSPGEAEDALSKTLNDDIPEYIDVVMLSGNNIWLCTKGRQWTYQPPLPEIFNGRGEYLITIALRGSSGATCKVSS